MRSLIAALVLLTPGFAVAQRAPFAIPDPDPEVERQSFLVADGFEVNLFAADPRIAKPIQMNFDPAGRLWIVSSEVYPQIKPGQSADDKVIVLEDRDGDGTSDSTTVFAEGLLIPTGIEPGDGGAYVANSTELLHFRDTDGDGKADRRRVMLSGFGTEDTHHILHTLRWGYDGMLYFNQSIYIHSHVETPHGVRRLGGGGIWEFRPETMELAVFMRGLVNPWGHHFDRWGQSFATDGAGGEGINYVLPGAYYVTAPDAVRILKGLNPGSPKHCGAEVVSGRHLPDDWSGNIVTNDFRGNRVCRFVLQDDGAGYASREQPELIKTKHVAFRPIDVKMGPDGAIYIADWYNPIIQHGEVDFRDPRRDHTRGRIWRVTAKGRPLVARPKLVGASTEELLEALKAPEDWTRQQAKRVIKERGNEVAPTLAAWVQGLAPADPQVEHHRLEGLWTYQSLDLVEPDLLAKLLRASDPRVRAAATRVASHWHPRLSDPLALLEVQVADDNPRVRLEAVRALAQIPRTRSVELAMRALDRPVDRFLDYALWLTARELAPYWLAEAEAGGLDFGGNSRHLVFALEAVGSKAVVKPLLASLRTGRLPATQEANALALIAARGEPNDLATLNDWAVGESPLASERRVGYLKALTQATRQRKVRPAGDLTRLGRLLDGPDEALREAAARAAGLWGVEPLRTKLQAIARADETRDPLRRAAIDGLELSGGPGARQALEELAGASAWPGDCRAGRPRPQGVRADGPRPAGGGPEIGGRGGYHDPLPQAPRRPGCARHRAGGSDVARRCRQGRNARQQGVGTRSPRADRSATGIGGAVGQPGGTDPRSDERPRRGGHGAGPREARRGDLPPQGPRLPQVPRPRRGGGASRAQPRKRRCQRPGRLPGRLAAPTQQGDQGELPRGRGRHDRRADRHGDQGPPVRHRAGPARRRRPRARPARGRHRGAEAGRLADAGRPH